MPQIHPTAIVAPGATLAEDVSIGPYCVVGEEVVLGAGVTLIAHIVVDGRTTIGEKTRIFPFASIGLEPQDLKYRGEKSRLVIGRHNTIREHVTMNPGTEGGGMVTRVGDHGLFMVGAHVAHDCQIGDHVIMANNATLAGHVVVEDYALLGGLSAVHQFVRIGQHAMIGGMSGVERDVIPYGQVMGDRARLSGLNIIGMQRRGFSREDIQTLRSAYQFLFSADGTFNDRVTEMAERFGGVAPVDDIIAFIRADSTRAICQPKGPNGG
ncbi:MAG: acyl-[acyl-carrier-protein]--UDP-N-acetylglucosamine O-acyltransferase [Alphaproteobacteria bacterium 13_1_20CM_3_64_12]|jgi:UDP-N-acetylglucosamine acyltransferase|nr:MAG: acyl-[acyl-carrier-protein]--UDP-N-acetylglucosamine O-acyltransferase [Alphaproteobacteria bacterium 13_1_20CM_4_65_11]OLE34237.1 MAG: acyl-[acyl-carrier-protein]--UDP-N-acetylglucosamine O-acyltransferase [Alphaproteobacteria bacterium 13_1_20CM_3_64_12]TMK08348.1 MAG: acyl-ACP--UDP-N-acetylglucosamine O-acyltransferase [Alphaproteobacteria bacterium]TMK27487.1 MAG: acyl-ACP--UDP-N-acetylglucosamine O-acyltransferase [Alphaproteobacteria bacterium]